MIIYGTFTETSIAKLFMAGLLPGLLLTGLFMLYVGARALCNSSLAPKERVEKSDPTPYGRLAATLLTFAGLLSLVLGWFIFGFATPPPGGAGGRWEWRGRG